MFIHIGRHVRKSSVIISQRRGISLTRRVHYGGARSGKKKENKKQGERLFYLALGEGGEGLKTEFQRRVQI